MCPSVTSRCSIETAKRIELVFSMWASFHPSYSVLKGNSVSSKNKGTSLWNFVLNSGLRKFRHRKSSVYRWYQQLVRDRFVYDTYRTMKATRSRHSWVHMFITHCPIVTLQLHNFDLVRTCRTSSFCTVAWQLARFQLTRRIARSLGDSWASCWWMLPTAVWWRDPFLGGVAICFLLPVLSVTSVCDQKLVVRILKVTHQRAARNWLPRIIL